MHHYQCLLNLEDIVYYVHNKDSCRFQKDGGLLYNFRIQILYTFNNYY